MSVELPEAYILAEQMNKELIGKTVASCYLQNCTNYQRIGLINTYLSDFDQLVDHKITSVVYSGNTIRMQFKAGLNLLHLNMAESSTTTQTPKLYPKNTP